ncbi:MAG TPA: pteridine reductase [Gammaproteobacteria bacterium]|nr:pteridine reductase [Gammaproteobacteria bacterium]
MNDSSVLDGKVTLLTGAAKRLGATLARAVQSHGASVAIHYHRSGTAAAALVEELNSIRRESALALAADLLEVESLPTVVGTVLERFGRLDVLINNASTFYPTPLGTITEQQWTDLIGTNLKAPLFLSQAAAPALKASGGLILNLVDIHALRPLRRHTVYCAAKAGLAMLTRSLARELGPEIRVNGIAPGPVLWPETAMDEALKAEIVAKTVLKRRGSPEDIARAALFFAKDAPYVTGQILAVDGGRSVGW